MEQSQRKKIDTDHRNCPHVNDVEASKRLIILFTVEVLKDKGWANVDPSKVTLQNKSGSGGSLTYKISAEGANPPAVSYSCRKGFKKNDISELITFSCIQLFSLNGQSPELLGIGKDWFIYVWGGKTVGKFQTLNSYKKKIVLVKSNDPDRLIFENLVPQPFKILNTIKFLLVSHPGKALTLNQEKKDNYYGHNVEYLTLDEKNIAQDFIFDEGGFIRKADEPTQVFDCAFSSFRVGNDVLIYRQNSVKQRFVRNYDNIISPLHNLKLLLGWSILVYRQNSDKQRFVRNQDNTISPLHNLKVVLGWNSKLILVQQNDERQLVFCDIQIQKKAIQNQEILNVQDYRIVNNDKFKEYSLSLSSHPGKAVVLSGKNTKIEHSIHQYLDIADSDQALKVIVDEQGFFHLSNQNDQVLYCSGFFQEYDSIFFAQNDSAANHKFIINDDKTLSPFLDKNLVFGFKNIAEKDESTTIEEIAFLLSQIHQIPSEWFEEFRVILVQQIPILKLVPKGSHVWWFTKRSDLLIKLHNERVLKQWFEICPKPVTKVLQKIVTVHGDFHLQNIIKNEKGELKVIDFEFSHVNYAAQDIAFSLVFWCKGINDRRKFVESYLKYMGEDYSQEVVDEVILDAQNFSLGCCIFQTSYEEVFRLSQSGYGDIYWKEMQKLVETAQIDKNLREQIIDEGLCECERGRQIKQQCDEIYAKCIDGGVIF